MPASPRSAKEFTVREDSGLERLAKQYTVKLKSFKCDFCGIVEQCEHGVFNKHQAEFICSRAKRKIICAGRQSGKTTAAAIITVHSFLEGRRILYAAPTSNQLDNWWSEVEQALAEPIEYGMYVKNKTRHQIDLRGTRQRIRGKTAWDAQTIRGDNADLLILDEWQMMNENAWQTVCSPMLMINNGDAIFIYTPPSAASISSVGTKAQDIRHASKMFKTAETEQHAHEKRIATGVCDTCGALVDARPDVPCECPQCGFITGRWTALRFTSHANPYLSMQGIAEISRDMTSLAYRQEIMAEDIDEVPGALWTRAMIDAHRIPQQYVPETHAGTAVYIRK